jgi:glycosyltransferase involved in cell wall biosynthesis
MKLISVIIPSYNEAEVLPMLSTRLNGLAKTNTHYSFEFLFVNDGSSDDTLAIIRQMATQNHRISYINLSRNFGKEAAMMAGFDHAKGDAAIVIDADLQDPPELIPQMIEFWENGYDDVYARRRSREGETWLKKKTSALYYRLLQSSTRVPIQIDTGDFRLLSRRAVNALKEYRESERNTKALFSLIGYKKKEIIYDRDARAAGETKWNYIKLIDLAINGLTSFTTAPLRIASVAGFLVSTFAFFYVIYLFIRPLFGVSTGDGYSSLMAAILFLGGVQLITIGIIGEYIGRIFIETKDRPSYLIEEYHEAKSRKN